MTQFYKEAVIDSIVWIGAKSKRDEYKKHCREIIGYFLDGYIKKVYITDYILVETISFLLKKEGFAEAQQALQLFLNSGSIEIVYVDELMLQDIKAVFERYKRLSLTDCSIVCLMQEKGIKTLFSLDSGFDVVKGIVRMNTV